jgi:hypothetical protein
VTPHRPAPSAIAASLFALCLLPLCTGVARGSAIKENVVVDFIRRFAACEGKDDRDTFVEILKAARRTFHSGARLEPAAKRVILPAQVRRRDSGRIQVYRLFSTNSPGGWYEVELEVDRHNRIVALRADYPRDPRGTDAEQVDTFLYYTTTASYHQMERKGPEIFRPGEILIPEIIRKIRPYCSSPGAGVVTYDFCRHCSGRYAAVRAILTLDARNQEVKAFDGEILYLHGGR